MQTDVWYDLVLRELSEGDDAVTERVKEALAAAAAVPNGRRSEPAAEPQR